MRVRDESKLLKALLKKLFRVLVVGVAKL